MVADTSVASGPRVGGGANRIFLGAFTTVMKPVAAVGLIGLILVTAFPSTGAEPPPARIEFARDIQPLLQTRCYACHGPDQQMGGMRLDRRSSALTPERRRLRPGSLEYSQIYQRLISTRNGPMMPLTGALPQAEIDRIKAWIEQGAEWPDALAGDELPGPPDAVVVRLREALRLGDRRAFERIVAATPDIAGRRGPDDTPPLMYAAFYGDAGEVRRLLDAGADPNRANAAGATPLMWAVADLKKTRLLLDRGADPNAPPAQGRTPLSIAAAQGRSDAIVALLLDRGAKPNGAALIAAAAAENEPVFQLLVARGAPVKDVANVLLQAGMRARCATCVEAALKHADRAGLNRALIALSTFGDTPVLGALLDRGAEVNFRPATGRPDIVERTPLMLAANSDLLPVETVRMLIARGADPNIKGPDGETALDLARRNGDTPVTQALVAAGAKPGGAFPTAAVTPRPAASVQAALARSLPLLQRTDVRFIDKTGCASCHHNTFTATTMAAVRTRGLPFDEATAKRQRDVIAAYLEGRRETAMLGGDFVTNNAGHILVGLAAEGHPADPATDAFAYMIKNRQLADGRWRNVGVDHRPPIQAGDIDVTAVAIGALKAYAPAPYRADYAAAVSRAAAWLRTAQPRETHEQAMQLLGLRWAGVTPGDKTIRRAARALLAQQRPDGGWAQFPTLTSDAYATGQVLYALHQAGALTASDPAYRRGVRYLLDTQLEDGSWYVKSRSIGFQPYFESGFPHGPDQWVSAGATNWAATALALALPRSVSAARR
jgi:ankyrin repeat protein